MAEKTKTPDTKSSIKEIDKGTHTSSEKEWAALASWAKWLFGLFALAWVMSQMHGKYLEVTGKWELQKALINAVPHYEFSVYEIGQGADTGKTFTSRDGLRVDLDEKSLALTCISARHGLVEFYEPEWKESFTIQGRKRSGILVKFTGRGTGDWMFVWHHRKGREVRGFTWRNETQTDAEGILKEGGDIKLDKEVQLRRLN